MSITNHSDQPEARTRVLPTAGVNADQVRAALTSSVAWAWRGAPTLSTLVPIRAWWDGKDWRRGTPVMFLAFALAPWVILHSIGPHDSITKAAWDFSIYFDMLWALVLWALIRPGKLDVGLAARVVFASAVFGIPLAIWLEERLAASTSLIIYVFGVGLPEEMAKALPVFVLMVALAERKTYSTKMFMFMGALSGLAFGAVEAVKYSSTYAQAMLRTGAAGLFSTGILWRLLTDGLFHAATAAITCYFLGLAAGNPRWRVQLIAVGLALTATLHGINDRLSGGWPQVAVAGGILFIFIGYVLTGDRIESEVSHANATKDG